MDRLPEHVVEAKSVNSFKNLLNKSWYNVPFKFVPNYDGPEVGPLSHIEEMDQIEAHA